MKYIPDKINGADYLSRHAMPLSPKDRRSVTYREATVRQLVLSVVPRAVSLTEIQTAMAQDPQLMKLLPLLLSGDKEGVKADSSVRRVEPRRERDIAREPDSRAYSPTRPSVGDMSRSSSRNREK